MTSTIETTKSEQDEYELYGSERDMISTILESADIVFEEEQWIGQGSVMLTTYNNIVFYFNADGTLDSVEHE